MAVGSSRLIYIFPASLGPLRNKLTLYIYPQELSQIRQSSSPSARGPAGRGGRSLGGPEAAGRVGGGGAPRRVSGAPRGRRAGARGRGRAARAAAAAILRARRTSQVGRAGPSGARPRDPAPPGTLGSAAAGALHGAQAAGAQRSSAGAAGERGVRPGVGGRAVRPPREGSVAGTPRRCGGRVRGGAAGARAPGWWSARGAMPARPPAGLGVLGSRTGRVLSARFLCGPDTQQVKLHLPAWPPRLLRDLPLYTLPLRVPLPKCPRSPGCAACRPGRPSPFPGGDSF